MISIDPGLWRLCQMAKHRGATRAAGKIDTKDSGTCLVFIIFYNPKEPGKEIVLA